MKEMKQWRALEGAGGGGATTLPGGSEEGLEGPEFRKFRYLYGLLVDFDRLLIARLYLIPDDTAKIVPRRKKRRLTPVRTSGSLPTTQTPVAEIGDNDE